MYICRVYIHSYSVTIDPPSISLGSLEMRSLVCHATAGRLRRWLRRKWANLTPLLRWPGGTGPTGGGVPGLLPTPVSCDAPDSKWRNDGNYRLGGHNVSVAPPTWFRNQQTGFVREVGSLMISLDHTPNNFITQSPPLLSPASLLHMIDSANEEIHTPYLSDDDQSGVHAIKKPLHACRVLPS